MKDALSIGYVVSPSARVYIEQTEYVRARRRTCSDQELVALLEKHGLPVSEAILDFERKLGGWSDPYKLTEAGFGIYLSLQEGEAVSGIAEMFRRMHSLFETERDAADEEGDITPIYGTGYPRAFFEDRALVPAGMFGRDCLFFVGAGGEIYEYMNVLGELFLRAASGRTLLEQRALTHRRWFTQERWWEMHICADVGELVAGALGVPHFEPACDRLFDVWANEHVQVRLFRDVAPNVFGTNVAAKSPDDLVTAIRRVRAVVPDAPVTTRDVNNMRSNDGPWILAQAGLCLGTPGPHVARSGAIIASHVVGEFSIGYPLSLGARAYVEQAGLVRQRHRTCSDEELVALLEKHGLPVSEAILDFERNLGGWNYPAELSEHGLGIFLALQEGEGCHNVAKLFRSWPRLFERTEGEPDEEGNLSPIRGSGFPRIYFQDKALVPAGMRGEEALQFIGTEGEIYTFNLLTNELFLHGASGRTFLEQLGLVVGLRPFGETWEEMHICADVAELVATELGVPRFEPACDRLFDVWANERVHVRLVRSVAPNVFGTHIAAGSTDDLIKAILRVRAMQPNAEVSQHAVNNMQSNAGPSMLAQAGLV